MASLLAKAVAGVLVRKAKKSVTSWIGGAVAGVGGAAAVNPELLELIPEQARGYAVMAIGVGVLLARHRADIIAAYAKLRAEIKAAEAAAENETQS